VEYSTVTLFIAEQIHERYMVNAAPRTEHNVVKFCLRVIPERADLPRDIRPWLACAETVAAAIGSCIRDPLGSHSL
jgi:hypothetical protein